jgi:hypothetical protein
MPRFDKAIAAFELNGVFFQKTGSWRLIAGNNFSYQLPVFSFQSAIPVFYGSYKIGG